ncbi:hypothetical protein D3C76_1874690 [compost metagenome]
MSAPPIGMMISTPMMKARASIKAKALRSPVNMKVMPRPRVATPSSRFSLC